MNNYRLSAHIVIATAGASKNNTAIHGMQSIQPYQTRDNVAQFGLHGVVSRPLPGAQMVIAYGAGDPSNSICIAVNDPRYHLQNLPDGVIGLAHHLGAQMLFYADHIGILGNGMPITIENAGQVTIKTSSKVRIEGDLEVTGEVTARVDGAAVHLSTHHHTGVLTGGGNTGGPVG